MHGRYRPFSMIEPVEIMLTHKRNELLRVVGGGGISGLVDFAGKRLRIVLELKSARIAAIAKEKPRMIGDALFEAVVLCEIGIDGDPLAANVFPCRRPDGARRPAAFDAEQVLGFADCVLSPPRLKNCLSY